MSRAWDSSGAGEVSRHVWALVVGLRQGARAGGSGRKTAWNRNSVPQAEESLRHLPQPEATPSRLSNHPPTPPHTHLVHREMSKWPQDQIQS